MKQVTSLNYYGEETRLSLGITHRGQPHFKIAVKKPEFIGIPPVELKGQEIYDDNSSVFHPIVAEEMIEFIDNLDLLIKGDLEDLKVERFTGEMDIYPTDDGTYVVVCTNKENANKNPGHSLYHGGLSLNDLRTIKKFFECAFPMAFMFPNAVGEYNGGYQRNNNYQQNNNYGGGSNNYQRNNSYNNNGGGYQQPNYQQQGYQQPQQQQQQNNFPPRTNGGGSGLPPRVNSAGSQSSKPAPNNVSAADVFDE